MRRMYVWVMIALVLFVTWVVLVAPQTLPLFLRHG
jgi:hypothetical protein